MQGSNVAFQMLMFLSGVLFMVACYNAGDIENHYISQMFLNFFHNQICPHFSTNIFKTLPRGVAWLWQQ